MTMQLHVVKRASGVAPTTIVAILALVGCGSDGDGTAEQPPSTAVESLDDRPVTAPPPTAPRPDTIPATSPPPTVPDDQLYEAITAVIEETDGPRMCFEVLDSLPPQCGSGVQLVDWSWDSINVERVQNGTTWVDQIYVSGTYDDIAQAFTVDDVRLPTDADRERLLLSHARPDFSVPCPPPQGGWPARTQEWPGDEIVTLDGYAGAWIDEGGHVMTVKFTGDLDAAEAAVREHYTDALCVVSAEHDAAELSSIQEQLQELSSVQILGSGIYVDASGEWVAADTFAPDPARQAAFDEQFGAGVVRLGSVLHAVPSA